MPRNGPRWYGVECRACGVEHGFSAGALVVSLNAAQYGELVTVKGNAVCLLTPLRTYVPNSTEPKVSYTERMPG